MMWLSDDVWWGCDWVMMCDEDVTEWWCVMRMWLSDDVWWGCDWVMMMWLSDDVWWWCDWVMMCDEDVTKWWWCDWVMMMWLSDDGCSVIRQQCDQRCGDSCYGPGETECCSLRCVGGCSGPGRDECYVRLALFYLSLIVKHEHQLIFSLIDLKWVPVMRSFWFLTELLRLK